VREPLRPLQGALHRTLYPRCRNPARSKREHNSLLRSQRGEPLLQPRCPQLPRQQFPRRPKKAFRRKNVAAARTNGPVAQVVGISQENVAEIKAAIQAQQKFLGEIVEQSNRWELEGAELRLYFSPEKRPFAELLEGRESLEKIRVISSKVLGRTVRVCAKLETVAAAAASSTRGASGTQELRAQFERDPMVRSLLQRFGGKISEVKRNQEES